MNRARPPLTPLKTTDTTIMKKSALRLLATLALATLGYASALHAASTITYLHNDLLGSPVVATNQSGQVIWRESYRPFGERLTNAPTSQPNDVWFTGRRQDVDTGLVYMGARFYDPVIGRFISKDPVGFEEKNVHSFNRYAYANNNPFAYKDPNGAWSVFFQDDGTTNDTFARVHNERTSAVFEGTREAISEIFDWYLTALALATAVDTGGASVGAKGAAATFDAARAGHIFRESAGHVNPGSASSQARFARLFENVTATPANLRADAIQAGIIPQDAANAGVQAFTQVARSGKQIWVTAKDGTIQNAGVNPAGAVR
jgi:RHS repeat-associated protein